MGEGSSVAGAAGTDAAGLVPCDARVAAGFSFAADLATGATALDRSHRRRDFLQERLVDVAARGGGLRLAVGLVGEEDGAPDAIVRSCARAGVVLAAVNEDVVAPAERAERFRVGGSVCADADGFVGVSVLTPLLGLARNHYEQAGRDEQQSFHLRISLLLWLN